MSVTKKRVTVDCQRTYTELTMEASDFWWFVGAVSVIMLRLGMWLGGLR